MVEDCHALLARSFAIALADVADFEKRFRERIKHHVTPSGEAQTMLGKAEKRSPKESIKDKDECRHYSNAEHDLGIVAGFNENIDVFGGAPQSGVGIDCKPSGHHKGKLGIFEDF